MKPVIAPLAALVLLSACGSQGEFPSLAKRQAELALEARPAGSPPAPAAAGAPGRITGSGAPAAPAPDATASERAVSGDLAARLRELGDSAREAHDRFGEKRERARQLVAAANGAQVASEAWSVATVAVADLESARSDAMISLGELDRLYAAERIDGGDGVAIAAVRDQVTAWVADEDAVLAELGNRLKT
ncbi:hypothetical protein H7F51_09765 [Novosphingobium flavum]|uniref:DUF4398 domain-containing protein n=1 Tax=Novosphingobium flavum TaxID=1778672 RepID=A0A7X1FRU4_9SPHN|nr:hypothetical protein [Novosphingobium flavum]MBC2665810.1 hypothetical protein [Novosphingobium flavum]